MPSRRETSHLIPSTDKNRPCRQQPAIPLLVNREARSVQGHPWLHNRLGDSLDYIRSWIKDKIEEQEGGKRGKGRGGEGGEGTGEKGKGREGKGRGRKREDREKEGNGRGGEGSGPLFMQAQDVP